MIGRFFRNTDGSPSVELVLSLPIMIVLMFGGMEAGHFAWTQHKLVKAVREGARFAARLPVDKFCDSAGVVSLDTDAEADIKAVTLSGQLPDSNGDLVGAAVVPGMGDANVSVSPTCEAFATDDDGNGTGIYSALGGGGPVVIVSASNVAYPSLFNSLTGLDSSVELAAKSSAPVIGI